MARFAATHLAARALTAALFGLTAAAAAAQGFPSKPIRIIVNTAPGGLTDVTLYFLRVMARRNALADQDYDLLYGGGTPNRFAHPHDDLLPHTHERCFGILLFQLPLAIGAPG